MTFDFARKTGIGWEGWNEQWGNGLMEYWDVWRSSHHSNIPLFLTCGNFSDKKETTQWAK